jgi:hypothetical protein
MEEKFKKELLEVLYYHLGMINVLKKKIKENSEYKLEYNKVIEIINKIKKGDY